MAYRIEELIDLAAQQGASDIHLVEGLPPKCRIDGRLQDLADTPLTDPDCEDLARQLAGGDYDRISRIGELDLAVSSGGRRVRVNLFRQQGHVSAALRILSDKIPELSKLGLPQVVGAFPAYN